jgi:hypothetical protein
VLRGRGYAAQWDMSEAEGRGNFFEGTGVLVLDRVNGVAYVNLSERADAGLARAWVDRMGYKVGARHLLACWRTCRRRRHELAWCARCPVWVLAQ